MATTSPVTQQNGPLFMSTGHVSVCVCVCVCGGGGGMLLDICLLSACQLLFMDPAVDPGIVHFVAIRTHSSSSNFLFVGSTMVPFCPSASSTLPFIDFLIFVCVMTVNTFQGDRTRKSSQKLKSL